MPLQALQHSNDDRKKNSAVRAEERHSPRRRGAVHPLVARAAAVDRRGDAVRPRARAHHGALRRSRHIRPGGRARPRHRAGDRGARRARASQPERLRAGRVQPDLLSACCASAFPPPPSCRATPTACAASLGGLLQQPAAAIVSGLPLFTKPMRMRLRPVPRGARAAAPGAPFVQFTYAVVPPIPKRLAGVRAEASERIWKNMPPARVWVYRGVRSRS